MDAIRVAKVRCEIAEGNSRSPLTRWQQVDNVRLELIHGADKEDLNGTLHLTAHHLLFCADGHSEIWVGT